MKKVLVILAACLVVLTGCFGSSKKEESGAKSWNPYSSEAMYLSTLNDLTLSAANGNRIVKMTISLNFGKQANFEKFKGYNEPGSAPKEAKKEKDITPMEVAIRDIISNTMMKISEKDIMNQEAVKNEILNAINAKLGLDKDFISAVYLEGYIVQ